MACHMIQLKCWKMQATDTIVINPYFFHLPIYDMLSSIITTKSNNKTIIHVGLHGIFLLKVKEKRKAEEVKFLESLLTLIRPWHSTRQMDLRGAFLAIKNDGSLFIIKKTLAVNFIYLFIFCKGHQFYKIKFMMALECRLIKTTKNNNKKTNMAVSNDFQEKQLFGAVVLLFDGTTSLFRVIHIVRFRNFLQKTLN